MSILSGYGRNICLTMQVNESSKWCHAAHAEGEMVKGSTSSSVIIATSAARESFVCSSASNTRELPVASIRLPLHHQSLVVRRTYACPTFTDALHLPGSIHHLLTTIPRLRRWPCLYDGRQSTLQLCSTQEFDPRRFIVSEQSGQQQSFLSPSLKAACSAPLFTGPVPQVQQRRSFPTIWCLLPLQLPPSSVASRDFGQF